MKAGPKPVHCWLPNTSISSAGGLVEMPEEADLSGHPFVYEAQYRLATRVHTIGFDDFNEASEKLPTPEHLLFLHSTG